MNKKLVIDHFGSQQAVANALGISQVAVHKWKDNIPELRAYQIEKITEGALKVEGISANGSSSRN
ncbi:Cro/Cl family transcriptional regulator [Vibrio mediterranei]|uniref:Cro/CI family transcriptional regulator n=1 Tax=Vibrio mediterranei TaxID=689 RepID=UPI0018107411|nr:Cro/CI family transcriptional regulator [Vibrio mediterranei]NUW71396.1 Cro/Cl family transcriptional regulator [Vibrio mediterranei]